MIIRFFCGRHLESEPAGSVCLDLLGKIGLSPVCDDALDGNALIRCAGDHGFIGAEHIGDRGIEGEGQQGLAVSNHGEGVEVFHGVSPHYGKRQKPGFFVGQGNLQLEAAVLLVCNSGKVCGF